MVFCHCKIPGKMHQICLSLARHWAPGKHQFYVEYDRKAYGRSFGRYNGRKLRPQWKGKNFLFRSFGRKVTFSWKCPLAAERSSYGRNYGLAVLLKEHFFSWKSCLTAVRAPFGRKNPYGRILRLRCKWDFFNLPYYGCGERPKTPFGRTLVKWEP